MGFRYIGAKTKVIPEIVKKITSIAGKHSHIVDLMCGTGAVSASLKQEGFTVTAVDVNDAVIPSYCCSPVIGFLPRF